MTVYGSVWQAKDLDNSYVVYAMATCVTTVELHRH